MITKADIRRKIEDSGVKKAFIAQRIGMSRQGLAYHLEGEGRIDLETGLKILSVLETFGQFNRVNENKIKGNQNTIGINNTTNTDTDKLIELRGQVADLKLSNLELRERIAELTEELQKAREKLNAQDYGESDRGHKKQHNN